MLGAFRCLHARSHRCMFSPLSKSSTDGYILVYISAGIIREIQSQLSYNVNPGVIDKYAF